MRKSFLGRGNTTCKDVIYERTWHVLGQEVIWCVQSTGCMQRKSKLGRETGADDEVAHTVILKVLGSH